MAKSRKKEEAPPLWDRQGKAFAGSTDKTNIFQRFRCFRASVQEPSIWLYRKELAVSVRRGAPKLQRMDRAPTGKRRFGFADFRVYNG